MKVTCSRHSSVIILFGDLSLSSPEFDLFDITFGVLAVSSNTPVSLFSYSIKPVLNILLRTGLRSVQVVFDHLLDSLFSSTMVGLVTHPSFKYAFSLRADLRDYYLIAVASLLSSSGGTPTKCFPCFSIVRLKPRESIKERQT